MDHFLVYGFWMIFATRCLGSKNSMLRLIMVNTILLLGLVVEFIFESDSTSSFETGPIVRFID